MKISSVGSRDRFLLTIRNEVAVCLKIFSGNNNQPILKCRVLSSLGDFYETPTKSTKLNIHWCETKYKAPAKLLEIHEIKQKLFRIPFDSTSMYFAPLKKL